MRSGDTPDQSFLVLSSGRNTRLISVGYDESYEFHFQEIAATLSATSSLSRHLKMPRNKRVTRTEIVINALHLGIRFLFFFFYFFNNCAISLLIKEAKQTE